MSTWHLCGWDMEHYPTLSSLRKMCTHSTSLSIGPLLCLLAGLEPHATAQRECNCHYSANASDTEARLDPSRSNNQGFAQLISYDRPTNPRIYFPAFGQPGAGRSDTARTKPGDDLSGESGRGLAPNDARGAQHD